MFIVTLLRIIYYTLYIIIVTYVTRLGTWAVKRLYGSFIIEIFASLHRCKGRFPVEIRRNATFISINRAGHIQLCIKGVFSIV